MYILFIIWYSIQSLAINEMILQRRTAHLFKLLTNKVNQNEPGKSSSKFIIVCKNWFILLTIDKNEIKDTLICSGLMLKCVFL